MFRAMRFYVACVREAAQGTIERANAWFWLIGVPIVALAGRYWEIGELTIPDTPLELITLMVVTVGVTWVVFFAIRLVGAPARLFWREHDVRLTMEAQLAALAAPDADWPIHELFSHIRPDVLERSDDGAVWDEVGNDVRDKLSLGRLKGFGRPVGDGISKILGERPALRQIAPDYWHSSHFTFHFFDNTAGDAPHTYVDHNSGLPEFTDLRVNRAEALLVWPSGC
jgi:hypothetical protein